MPAQATFPSGIFLLGPVNNPMDTREHSHFTDSERAGGEKSHPLSYRARLPPSPGDMQAGVGTPTDRGRAVLQDPHGVPSLP